MPKLFAVILLLLATTQVVGQSSVLTELPSVRTNSSVIDLQIDDGPIMKGAWHLNPEIDLDCFVFGSDLPYGTKKITFKTDVDDISFDVVAGNEYDFVFMLDGDTPYPTRIWARPDPAVWNLNVLIPVCVLFVALGVFVIAKWNSLPQKWLLGCGLLGPLLFWVATFVSAPIRGDYHHFNNVISQLGEVGSKAEVFTSVAFIAVGALSLLFSIGLYKSSQQFGVSVIPSILTLAIPVTIIWAAFFPLGNDLHGVIGPLPLALNLGAVLAFFLWKKNGSLSSIRRWSLVSFLFMMLLFLLFTPLAQHYEGLIQRFWYLGWSIWFGAMSLDFMKQIVVSNSSGYSTN